MELWIPVTLLAALAQTIRFGLMTQLKRTQLSSTGATFARYVFSAPLAMAIAVAYGAALGVGWPGTPLSFWAYAAAGGITQILATVCLMSVFARRSFSVGIAFTKTTVLMAVPVGWVLLGDTTSWIGFAAIVLGFVGVLLLSDVPSDTGARFWERVFNPATALGLAAGLLFAVAGVGYRGAVLDLGAGDAVFRAVFTLAWATALQTGIMAVWMRIAEPGEISRTLSVWRISGLVGVMSMIGSTCWFIAFTMQNVAYVNAVGQVELLFSLALTVFVFKEPISRREWQGGAVLMVSILALILYA
ncbi:MAG: DMT family transporter [Pseudomonadota bacterium]